MIGGFGKKANQSARRLMVTVRPSFDFAYLRWRAKFTPFETGCFEAVCDFVYAHSDDLPDRFYCEGHESLNDFPGWAFERYLRDAA